MGFVTYVFCLQSGRLCGNPVDLGKTAYCDYHVAAEMRNMHSLRGPLLDNNLRIGVAPRRTTASKGVNNLHCPLQGSTAMMVMVSKVPKQGRGWGLDDLHCPSVPGEREEEHLLSIAGS